jgi:hypothetical protein
VTGRRCVIVDPSDTVATLLDDDRAASRLQDGRACAPGIPFGHKVALRPIAEGEPVLKYGVAIGIATQSIGEGEHVHVHNCR